MSSLLWSALFHFISAHLGHNCALKRAGGCSSHCRSHLDFHPPDFITQKPLSRTQIATKCVTWEIFAQPWAVLPAGDGLFCTWTKRFRSRDHDKPFQRGACFWGFCAWSQLRAQNSNLTYSLVKWCIFGGLETVGKFWFTPNKFFFLVSWLSQTGWKALAFMSPNSRYSSSSFELYQIPTDLSQHPQVI